MNHLSSNICQKACVQGKMLVHLHKDKMDKRCFMDNRSIELFSNCNPRVKWAIVFISLTLRTERMQVISVTHNYILSINLLDQLNHHTSQHELQVQLRNRDLTRKLLSIFISLNVKDNRENKTQGRSLKPNLIKRKPQL